MLILLFIFTLIRHFNGAPTAIPPGLVCDPTDFYIRDNPIHKHLTSRTVNNIVVSCLATIFACTWKAIHPNIPGPCDSGWEKFKRKVTTTIYAIVAPEMITAWALRQHLAARRIAKEYNDEVIDERSWIVRSIEGIKVWFCDKPLRDLISWLFWEPLEAMKKWFCRHPAPPVAREGDIVKWTITHGFFIQMGGFMLCEGGKQLKPLDQVGDLKDRVRRKEIGAPRITKGEIEDRRSKGDGLTKAIVILQTTWFIAQCLVRWSSSLPVTELEILTLGFATLNGITYALWWHKPQSVRLPVYLEMKGMAGITTGERQKVRDKQQGRARDEDSVTSMEVAPEQVELMAGGDETHRVVDDGADERKTQVAGRARIAADPAQPAKRSELSRSLEEVFSDGWKMIWEIPYYLIITFFNPLVKMIMPMPSEAEVEEDQLRVPMFHSGDADAVTLAIASSAIGSIFGLIHFIPAFFLVFSSRPEMFLWRISAGIIAVHPIFLGVSVIYIDANYLQRVLRILMVILLLLCSTVYVIARLALITLAFISLRTIHGNALATVDWISFIPHL